MLYPSWYSPGMPNGSCGVISSSTPPQMSTRTRPVPCPAWKRLVNRPTVGNDLTLPNGEFGTLSATRSPATKRARSAQFSQRRQPRPSATRTAMLSTPTNTPSMIPTATIPPASRRPPATVTGPITLNATAPRTPPATNQATVSSRLRSPPPSVRVSVGRR